MDQSSVPAVQQGLQACRVVGRHSARSGQANPPPFACDLLRTPWRAVAAQAGAAHRSRSLARSSSRQSRRRSRRTLPAARAAAAAVLPPPGGSQQPAWLLGAWRRC